MGWNATTKRVTAPVSIRTFQRAFGIFSTKVLHRIVKRAAAAGTINKWAKYKPVEYSGWSTVGQLNTLNSDHANWNWRVSADWWKGSNGKCGLDIQSFVDFGSMTNQATFLYKLIHGELPWNYAPPTTKFRMFDLIHYYADAIKPVGDSLPTTDFWLSTQGVLEFGYDIENIDSDNLSLADISVNNIPLSQHYLGVLLYQGSRWWALTSTAQLGTGSADIHIENASALVGQWYVIPFLSATQMTINSTIGEGQYMSFDVQTPQLITIHAAGTIIDLYAFAYWDSLGRTVSWELVVQSNQNAARTLTNVIVYLYSTDADVPSQQPESGQLEAQSSAMTVVVPAMGRVTRTGTLTPRLPRTSAKTYWVVVDSDGDFAKHYNQVEDDPSIMPE